MREVFSSMINMDGPRHTQLRRIVSREFAPRRLEMLQRNVERITGNIIDDISPRGSCDVVTDISSQLPLKIIYDMMGIPPSEYKFVLKCTNVIFGAYEPEYVDSGPSIFSSLLKAGRELAQLMRELRDLRLKNPMDDLTSVLVPAEIDGQRLTTDELASFFVLLVAAGNETTRSAISWGVWLLSQHPEQRADLAKDPAGLIAGAVERDYPVGVTVNLRAPHPRCTGRIVRATARCWVQGRIVLLVSQSGRAVFHQRRGFRHSS
jgi:methyl-branched lipid omega-hydroxylase